VLSADAVYVQDYGALVEEHMASDAAVTMVTTKVDPDDAARYGVVQVEGGKVADYAYKPERPASNLVASEVFVFRPGPLLEALEDLAGEAGDDGLDDLGDALLPRLVAGGGAREARFDGYWRDVGTVDAYWDAHQELLEDPPPIDLDDPAWPILTQASARRASAHVLRGADVQESMLAPAARVAGTVERSIVGRGAVVEAGAVVRESVLLPGAVVRSGAEAVRAVLDDAVEVGAGATVGGPGGEIALVGLRAAVGAGEAVPPGGRHPSVD
jgi:glucose-1-phosphate adenylyltransferase